MHVPQDIKDKIEKYDLVDYEYREKNVNGILFRSIIHEDDIGRCFKTFPIFKQKNPGLMLEWWISDEAISDNIADEELDEYLSRLFYHQFMQDVFEIVEIVIKNNTSGDVWKPVIPESAYN